MKTKKPKGLTLRAAAEALGVSRPKLKRMIRDGLPAKRRGELFDIDIDRARKWHAEHESPGAKRAPVLDPRDPRHRERTAAARLKAIKLGLANGTFVKVDEATERLANECVLVRTGLLNLNARFSSELMNATAADAERIIAAAIADVLSELKSDSPNEWPIPISGPQEPNAEDDDDWLEAAGRDLLPCLSPPDPRHAFALAAAQTREHELAELEANAEPLSDMLASLAEEFSEVRSVVRTIPFSVSMALSDGPNDATVIQDLIRRHVYLALCELSDTTPEPEGEDEEESEGKMVVAT